ncbi:dienelactone hydrolase family protein, partial [Bacteroidota bacterium]
MEVIIMLIKKLFFCFLLISVLFSQIVFAQSTGSSIARQELYLEQLLSILLPEVPISSAKINKGGPVTKFDDYWTDWLKRTGELPPDFDEMPSIPFLPDPLVLDEGGKNIPITTMEQWQEKREWMKKEIMHWVTGTFPPPPDNMQAEILSEKKDGDLTFRTVELRFGPDHKAKLTLELIIPPGEGPFPVFMTQGSATYRSIPVRRGYIFCAYNNWDTDAYHDIWYPEYDFARLMRRGWAAHRAVDYLYTLPVVDKEKIGLTGWSRNAKTSIMAAAFDERIAAVIMNGGGIASNTPFRYTGDKYDVESIFDVTTMFPNWLHPRVRFFVGRENKLPVDINHLYALVAPRGLMFATATHETLGNAWGTEQGYESAKRVYQFLGAEEKLEYNIRQSLHATSTRDLEEFIDFFDNVFGIKNINPEHSLTKDHLYYNYTFSKWMGLSAENINPLDYPEKGLSDLLINNNGGKITTTKDFEQKKKENAERIRWGLGEEPPGVSVLGPETTVLSTRTTKGGDFLSEVIGRPRGSNKMGMMFVSHDWVSCGGGYGTYGDYLNANLYYPIDENGEPKSKNLPVLIYLHEYDFSQGLNTSGIGKFFEGLVEQGFAVF